MAVKLEGAITRLVSINPAFRNTNDGGLFDQKAGPECAVRYAEGDWRILIESLNNSPTSNTARTCLATSADLLSYALYSGNPVFAPLNASPENDESTLTTVWWSPSLGKWRGLYHGGGNSVPRQVFLAETSDTSLQSGWTRLNGGNPVLPVGSAGSYYEHGHADAKVVRLASGTLVCLMRGLNATDKTQVSRATSTDDGLTWTVSASPVIAFGTAGTWCDSSFNGLDWFRDADGRSHLWVPGVSTNAAYAAGCIGYFYSDDDGVTWTQGANNPVLIGTGNSADPDQNVGDCLTCFRDGPDLMLGYMGFNSTYNPGGTRFEGRVRGILAQAASAPTSAARSGWGAPASGRHQVQVPNTGSILGKSVFSVLVRAKLPQHNTYREMYTEETAFNQTMYFRVNTAGQLDFQFRTPTAIASATSVGRVDDNTRRWFLLVRRANADFEMYTRDKNGVWTSLGTSTAAPGVTTGGNGAFFNWNSATTEPDEPVRGSLEWGLIVRTAALTTAQADTWIASETLPGGVTDYVSYHFGDGLSATVETDRSGNARNGTVNGLTIVDFSVPAALSLTGGKTYFRAKPKGGSHRMRA